MAINKVVYNGNPLIDLTGLTVTADKLAKGEKAIDKAGNIITGIMESTESGELPIGVKAIASGNYEIATDVAGNKEFTMEHNLGEIPDLFMFWSPTNISITYSMLYSFRCDNFGWRSSSYINLAGYRGSSSSGAISMGNLASTVGIKTLTDKTATIKPTSNSYYWRAGTYKWVAIKFN